MPSNAAALRSCTGSQCAGLSSDSRTRVFFLGARPTSERQQRAKYASFQNLRAYSVSHLSIVRQLVNAFSPFSGDLYGCHVPLAQKRAGRNFHMRSHGYHVGAPELRELLEWCPKDGKQIFPGTLPWGKER
jgi:hypothetical protein